MMLDLTCTYGRSFNGDVTGRSRTTLGNSLERHFLLFLSGFTDGGHCYRAAGMGRALGIGRLRPGREMGCGSLMVTT